MKNLQSCKNTDEQDLPIRVWVIYNIIQAMQWLFYIFQAFEWAAYINFVTFQGKFRIEELFFR